MEVVKPAPTCPSSLSPVLSLSQGKQGQCSSIHEALSRVRVLPASLFVVLYSERHLLKVQLDSALASQIQPALLFLRPVLSCRTFPGTG